MKFEIAHPDILYNYFKEMDEFDRHKEESFVGSGEEMYVPRGYCFRSTSVDLPLPLTSAGLQFHTNRGHYVGMISIACKNVQSFKGISAKLDRMFRNSDGLDWIPSNSNGAGYLAKNNVPLVAIGSCLGVELPHAVRLIAIGDFGAEPRKIDETFDEFAMYKSLLESTANSFIRACYSSKPKRGRVGEHDLQLFLNCIM
ncbi:MAG: hypothetical protein Q7S74_01345 [Nanoarchaeota archaeon]|nr:hypothetical protein [Nanoarchaeota archaeon]